MVDGDKLALLVNFAAAAGEVLEVACATCAVVMKIERS